MGLSQDRRSEDVGLTGAESREDKEEGKTRYTLAELMVAAAAREIKDGEVVFVGMRLPLIAFAVAKKTHAPSAVGLFENGVIRSTPSPELIYTMGDPPNLLHATQCLDMMGVMSLLQSGRVDLGFLGAAEVDRFGNLNSTQVHAQVDARVPPQISGEQIQIQIQIQIKDQQNPPHQAHSFQGIVRLPGSGGACDIASLAHRFVAMVEHSRHRLPEKVSYLTSPGNGSGRGWRKSVGLPRGGPSAVITTRAVLRFGEDGEAYLASNHPGVSVEQVVANTGWPLRVHHAITETGEPTSQELKAIREYDKEGFWTS